MGKLIIALASGVVTSEPDSATLNRSLEQAGRTGQPHLIPLYCALRDEGCNVLMAAQRGVPFAIDSSAGPWIAVIGDRTAPSLGPDGFDQTSLRRLVEAVSMATVMLDIDEEAYHEIVSWAVLKRHHVLIVETRAVHELEWVDYLQAQNPAAVVGVVLDRSGKSDA